MTHTDSRHTAGSEDINIGLHWNSSQVHFKQMHLRNVSPPSSAQGISCGVYVGVVTPTTAHSFGIFVGPEKYRLLLQYCRSWRWPFVAAVICRRGSATYAGRKRERDAVCEEVLTPWKGQKWRCCECAGCGRWVGRDVGRLAVESGCGERRKLDNVSCLVAGRRPQEFWLRCGGCLVAGSRLVAERDR